MPRARLLRRHQRLKAGSLERTFKLRLPQNSRTSQLHFERRSLLIYQVTITAFEVGKEMLTLMLAELRGREARGRETFGGELLAAAHGDDEELDSVCFAMQALFISNVTM
jgi:hypothetical protein